MPAIGVLRALGVVVGCLVMGVGLAGCESGGHASAGLPAPSFAAPVVATRGPGGMKSPAVRVSDGPTLAASGGGAGRTSGRLITPQPPQRTFAQASAPTPAGANGVPRDWIPNVKSGPWLWIVIHHTATPSGALARINASHKGKGWDEAGYHFVVGNGTESKDGQTEVGPRWPKQKTGAHTASAGNEFNIHGIGVVMVGNFDQTRPSRKQLESTQRLVAYLMKTYKIPASHVIGHRDAKATDCPGKYTNVAEIRRGAVRMLADAGETIPEGPKLALGPDGEMLRDVAGE